ncbi:hypothetical protein Ancab_004122 [Ancistrocladus abbreviatus]
MMVYWRFFKSTLPIDEDYETDQIPASAAAKCHNTIANYRWIEARRTLLAVGQWILDWNMRILIEGVLPDGKVVAIKQLSSKSKQGNREFVNEIGLISAIQHPNLVKLHGFCIDGKELLLVYEYVENNSLAHALFAKLDEEEKSHISTRIAGTLPMSYKSKETFWCLSTRILVQNSEEDALRLLNLALLCTNPSPTLRPRDGRFRELEMLSQDSQSDFSATSQHDRAVRTISLDGPSIDSNFSHSENEIGGLSSSNFSQSENRYLPSDLNN